MIRDVSNLSLPFSGVVANPQARTNYFTPQESIEAEISRLTWAVIDGKATSADRERLSDLVSRQHEFRRV